MDSAGCVAQLERGLAATPQDARPDLVVRAIMEVGSSQVIEKTLRLLVVSDLSASVSEHCGDPRDALILLGGGSDDVEDLVEPALLTPDRVEQDAEEEHRVGLAAHVGPDRVTRAPAPRLGPGSRGGTRPRRR